MGFCAIINRHRPDILDFDDCDVDKPMENLQRAFDAAEKELGVIKIVDPEDVCVPKPDDKAVLTYVSFLHHAFPEMPPPHWKKVRYLKEWPWWYCYIDIHTPTDTPHITHTLTHSTHSNRSPLSLLRTTSHSTNPPKSGSMKKLSKQRVETFQAQLTR